jgi:hypothetical protein
MTSITSRIASLLAALATAGAVSLAAAGTASAATAPAFGSPEQAGFAAAGAGAQFRYVQATITLPDASKFASEIGGFGVSVQLWSGKSVAVLGISNSTTAGNYSAAVAMFDPTQPNLNVYPNGLVCSTADAGSQLCPGTPTDWTDGSVAFAPGATIFISAFYDRATGGTMFLVKDPQANEFLSYTFASGKGISWREARVGAEFGCSPFASCSGSSPVPYNAPPAPVHLVKFSGIRLTTYSGHRAGFSSWWLHAKVLWTRNGLISGAVNARPHSLFDGGTAFNDYLQP